MLVSYFVNLTESEKQIRLYPEAFIRRIKKQSYIDSEELLNALNEPSPVSIRINRDKWARSPLDSEPVEWCRDGFYLSGRPSFTLDPLFHSGVYYPQEASGMFLEHVYNQVLGDHGRLRVLDLCGAPGGKSTHLSSMIGKEGLLIANEVIKSRVPVLAENITKWGLSNSIVTQGDSSGFGRIPAFFDAVVLDAPCSGEGMFRNSSAVREWSPKKAIMCSERQKRILMDIWPSLKQNGILIYITCTFNPAENEENIKWLSERYESESIKLDISGYKGITEINHKGICGYGFYPGRIIGEGLFISVLKKMGKENPYDTGSKKLKDNQVTRDEKRIAEKWSFFSSDRIKKRGDDIVAAAGNHEDYLALSDNKVRIVKPGITICKVKRKNYRPSHDLALSVGFRKGSFPELKLDISDALSFLSRSVIRDIQPLKGWNILTYNGLPLGFINNIGDRSNNYYPAEWRIRMNISKLSGNIIQWDLDNI